MQVMLQGAFIKERHGSCKYSDFCVFSFHAIKSITVGEIGAVSSKTKEMMRK